MKSVPDLEEEKKAEIIINVFTVININCKTAE